MAGVVDGEAGGVVGPEVVGDGKEEERGDQGQPDLSGPHVSAGRSATYGWVSTDPSGSAR